MMSAPSFTDAYNFTSVIIFQNEYLFFMVHFFGGLLTDEKIRLTVSHGWDNDTWKYYVFFCSSFSVDMLYIDIYFSNVKT